MKKTVLASAVMIVGYAAAPLAQQQPATAPTSPPAHNVFVVTGCLNAADAHAPDDMFTLTDASSIGQSPPVGAAEAGAIGTSGLKASYDLRPASGVNAQGMNAKALKAHAGQRVEVTLRPIETMPAPPPTSSPTPGRHAAEAVDAPPQRFSVTQIRRVIGTCS